MKLRGLRFFLIFSACTWLICLAGLFLDWPTINHVAMGMGAQSLAYDPMLVYWLRMVCGAFSLVGLWYLLLGLYPRKYAVAIPWAGWMMIVEGVILVCSGLSLHIGPFPFLGDIGACFLGGGGILLLAKAAK